ncbi:MAG: hypothetical protein DRP55_10325 [Spirochaetes bacterium]|nr:MAG: hypothetical protein DRP55_10325 [Spirochaetota bacterium]
MVMFMVLTLFISTFMERSTVGSTSEASRGAWVNTPISWENPFREVPSRIKMSMNTIAFFIILKNQGLYNILLRPSIHFNL